ncbi:aldo/keto reductase [bacterium]|nr:MAG: aldo/keto reductase [bacterium]
MKMRPLGSTGYDVSEISFGCWAIGGTWGEVDDQESMAALHRAVDLGVNFFDTADVYGDGHSERLLARLKEERSEPLTIATKAGRRLNPHVAEGYNRQSLERFIDRSLTNLKTDALDLVQLHCPPTDAYYQPETFAALEDFKAAGKIKHFGVSVERVEEALKALEYPGVETVQIIFNVFRQRPADWFFERAKARNVGVLARVPLSSGMLTGKMTRQTQFSADDHRAFNRHGEAFDKGETFSGIDYDAQLDAVEELKGILPEGESMAQFALRWILMHDAVTCAIPGARRPAQVEDNVRAADLPEIPAETMARVSELYARRIKPLVHDLW